MAAGRPIIATSYFEWPEPYAEFVSVFDGEYNLNKFIMSVYENWNYEQFERAVQFANRNTWDKRLRDIAEIIGIDL